MSDQLKKLTVRVSLDYNDLLEITDTAFGVFVLNAYYNGGLLSKERKEEVTIESLNDSVRQLERDKTYWISEYNKNQETIKTLKKELINSAIKSIM